MKIYLDFNSTHPPDAAALKTARDFYLDHFANSSGLSLESQVVNKRIEEAREEIAKLCAVAPGQIVFTSCATEANNLLIREFHARRTGKRFRVLSSPFEHPSVSECLKLLPDTDIEFFKAEKDGGIDTSDFAQIPWAAFDLVVMMAVQNESGVVLPLAELVAALPANHVPVLADFSQALPKLAHDAPPALRPEAIAELARHNFFVTATGHKVGAGFGAGLIVTPPLAGAWKNTALLAGGNQEHGLRAGSHNIEAIIAFAEALKHKLQTNSHEKWRITSATLEELLLEKISPIHAITIVGVERAEPRRAIRAPEATNGPRRKEAGTPIRAPGTTLLLLPGVAIDFLIMALDKEGITVSTGTSCKSRSRSPSAALIAMGYTNDEALSVVRLSYGQDLSPQEMEFTADTIAAVLQKLGKF